MLCDPKENSLCVLWYRYQCETDRQPHCHTDSQPSIIVANEHSYSSTNAQPDHCATDSQPNIYAHGQSNYSSTNAHPDDANADARPCADAGTYRAGRDYIGVLALLWREVEP